MKGEKPGGRRGGEKGTGGRRTSSPECASASGNEVITELAALRDLSLLVVEAAAARALGGDDWKMMCKEGRRRRNTHELSAVRVEEREEGVSDAPRPTQALGACVVLRRGTADRSGL